MIRATIAAWAIGACIGCAMAAVLANGPTEQEAAEATQASLQDAIEQDRRNAADVRADYDLIEPTPARILHRYADLAGSKQ